MCVCHSVCVCVSDPWQRQSHRQTIRHKVAGYTEEQALSGNASFPQSVLMNPTAAIAFYLSSVSCNCLLSSKKIFLALRSSISWQILVSKCSRLISSHVLHRCCWWHAQLVQVVGQVDSRLSRGFPCRLTLGHILLVHATESSLENLEPEQNANSYMPQYVSYMPQYVLQCNIEILKSESMSSPGKPGSY